ncbi:MAG TPA: response regulator transcription factor [Verrucomicrobiae bacterium]|nr:response regulator transcription factor [Verrucomicrobiae bacterium]
MLPKESITVGILEDSLATRQGLAFIVNHTPGLHCVAACGSAEEAIPAFASFQPNVILCDINLPVMSGVEFVAKMHPLLPETQFLMLTVLEDYETIFAALRAGATGYLLKATPPVKLVDAIHEIVTGGSPMSSQVARQVIDAWKTTNVPVTAPAPRKEINPLSELSEREGEVLHLISLGFLYKEVADTLGISQGTVRSHIQRIYRKLHVRSKIEAIQRVRA